MADFKKWKYDLELDDMVYGVGNVQPPAEPATPQPAAASAEDPWHAAAAASDPWTSSAAPPGEGAAAAAWAPQGAAAAAWAPQTPEWSGGDIDAFAKGKGKRAGSKDQPLGLLEC